MKLRINSSSIRLRLSQKEVTDLVNKREIWDSCGFLNANLEYGLVVTEAIQMTAEMTSQKIQVRIPQNLVSDWHTNDKVGFETLTSEGLFILVEKDFKCLIERKNENESDLYDNPLA